MDRQLINYLPPVFREVREFQAITGIEQPDIENAWDNAGRVLDEQFLDSATEVGISRWEKILRVSHNAEESLEDRKFRIYALINANTPYTERVLREKLSELCEGGDYDLTIDHDNYALYISIALSRRSQYDSMLGLIERMVPANMIINPTLKYNRHIDVAAYTHAQLKAYTQNQLREDERIVGN